MTHKKLFKTSAIVSGIILVLMMILRNAQSEIFTVLSGSLGLVIFYTLLYYLFQTEKIKFGATNPTLKPFMYNDSTDGSIVFHAYPSSTTRNTKYSRSELREQMKPGENNVNWTFKDGAYMRGVLSVPEVTKDENGKYHRVIIMQIHGRLTNEQRDLIGEDDNNAPPILKIYWDKGKIRIKTKVLKDENATDTELLHEHAWGNDEGYNFPQQVGKRKFQLEVIVKDGEMEIILNKIHRAKYKDESIKRWGIFENYFKAGNYLSTTDANASSTVKYYDLKISHE